MRKLLIFGGTLAGIAVFTFKSSTLSHRSPAAAEVYEGLSHCLDRSYAGMPAYLNYEIIMDSNSYFTLPLSEGLEIFRNGLRLSDSDQREVLFSFFPSRHFIYVPETGRVRTILNSGSDAFSFPEGTTFIHEIYLDRKGEAKANLQDASALLEIRLERWLDGRWHYGIYDPVPKASSSSDCGGAFQLRTVTQSVPKELLMNESSGENIKISYKPLSPQSCVSCHAEGDSKIATFPCAFKPPSTDKNFTIHATVEGWVTEYTRKFGHSPLASEPR